MKGTFKDSVEGKCLRLLQGHTDWVTSVVHLDGMSVASGSSGELDGTLRIWDHADGKCSWIIPGRAGWLRSILHLKLLTDHGLL